MYQESCQKALIDKTVLCHDHPHAELTARCSGTCHRFRRCRWTVGIMSTRQRSIRTAAGCMKCLRCVSRSSAQARCQAGKSLRLRQPQVSLPFWAACRAVVSPTSSPRLALTGWHSADLRGLSPQICECWRPPGWYSDTCTQNTRASVRRTHASGWMRFCVD